MADAFTRASKPESAVPEATSNHANSSKSSSHFLFKAAIVTVFLVLLPLFPAQAPEFISHTLHARSWELLQLVLVGIAVSYGLFSKKNDVVAEKDRSSKLDSAQSYVSKLLQVSSVFDDESENPSVIDENNSNKIQTWNSQYYGVGSSVVREESGAAISQKPLLFLPVRSLKQRVPDSNEERGVMEEPGSVNRSDSKNVTPCNSRKQRNGEFGSFSSQKSVDKVEENPIVLRSPIPWRSRSGRMEMKENGEEDSPESISPELKPFRSFNLNSAPKISSSSSESHAKIREDAIIRKKNFPAPPSPPPPPPPPPPLHRLTKFNSSSHAMAMNRASSSSSYSSQKELRRSVRSVPAEELEEPPERKIVNSSLQLGKSVRTFRTPDHDADQKKSRENGTKFMERKKEQKDEPMSEKIQTLPPKDEDEELIEKVLVETTDEDSESDSDEMNDLFQGRSTLPNSDNSSLNDVVGPDVDKKADEFIAKFREQIRQQRIESIRRSTAQRAGKAFK